VDVSTNTIMDTKGKRRANKRWPEALKREIVAASLAPGVSVSTVARQYDVNANQVFGWRHRFGRASEVVQSPPLPMPPPSRPRLVPVTVSTEPEVASPPASASASDSGVEIEVADTYRIRVRADFDAQVLCRVLDCLGRAEGAREKRR
jgi:transposase